MGFFKKLFSRREPFVPTPTQTVPGLDPIVVQAVEILCRKPEPQKQVFEYFLSQSDDKITFNQLARLCISNGNLERLKTIHPRELYEFFMESKFRNMRNAEEWVKSITEKRQGFENDANEF
jgi:hypothetical protein